MSGCKSDRNEEDVKLDLDLLADFLNFPYDGQGEKPLKQKDPLSRLKRLHPFGEDFEFDLAWKDSKAVAELQAEILQVLDPLIGRRLKNKRLVKYHLEKLVAKIDAFPILTQRQVRPYRTQKRKSARGKTLATLYLKSGGPSGL